MTKSIMTMAEVSEMTGTPIDTLRYWRHRGEGPRSFRLGRRVVYTSDDVRAWIEQQRAAETYSRPVPPRRAAEDAQIA